MKKFLFYLSAVAVMFSSCSKDATEVSAPSLEKGVKAFSASIDVESENSTRLVVDGTKYLWSAGDAIGVASSTDLKANVFVSTPVGGKNPEFVVSSDDYERWMGDWKLNESPLYLYFPYKDGREFEAGGIINLSINKDQRYAPGSFYKNSVPAVGYAETYSGPEQELKLNIPTALIQVWFAGVGETQKIKLSIKNASGKYYQLNGSVDVDVTAEKPAFIFADSEGKAVVKDTADDSTYVTVNFGNKNGNLNYAGVDGNLPVHFIVPAGLDMSGATLEFELLDADNNKLDDEKYTMSVAENRVLPSNFRMNLQKTDGTPVYITFGMDGKFVIEDDEKFTAEEKFLGYAYMAQTQNADGYPATATSSDLGIDWGYMATLGADWNTIAWIKASTTPELDFTGYHKEWATQQYNALAAEINALGAQEPTLEQQFKLRLYKWYADNDGAIEPLAYNSIVGDDDEKPIVIKGLKVKGSGILGTSPAPVHPGTGTGAQLKNLEFVDCTVICSAQAGFVGTSDSYLAKLDNVTLGADNTVESSSASAYVGGLFGTMNATSLTIDSSKLVIEELPVVVSESINKGQVAGALNNIASVKAIDLSAYNVVDGGVAFAVVNGTADGVAMFSVPEDVELDGEVFAGVTKTASASIIVGDTAYWNGHIAASDNGVAPLTAEELAYYVSQRGDNRSVNLTNNYDLQGNVYDWGNVVNATTTLGGKLDVNGKISEEVNATISNVMITDVVKNNVSAYSLFGVNGSVKNVVIDGLTINVAEGGNHNYIAGLIHKAYALEGISVKNAKVSVASAVKASSVGEAAGLIAALIEGDDVTISDCHTDANCAFSVGTGTTRHTNRGMLLSTIDIKEGKEYNFENCSVAIGRMIGLANVTAGTSSSSDLPSVTFTDCEATTKIAKINWNGYTGNWAFMLDGNYANKSVTKY